MKKRLTAVIAAALLGALCVAGCGNSGEKAEETSAQPKEDAGQQETGEQKEEDEDKQSGDKEGSTAILVVSFGTSYNDSRDITIGHRGGHCRRFPGL